MITLCKRLIRPLLILLVVITTAFLLALALTKLHFIVGHYPLVIFMFFVGSISGYVASYAFYRMNSNDLHNTLVETKRLVGAIHRQLKQNQKTKWKEGAR